MFFSFPLPLVNLFRLNKALGPKFTNLKGSPSKIDHDTPSSKSYFVSQFNINNFTGSSAIVSMYIKKYQIISPVKRFNEGGV